MDIAQAILSTLVIQVAAEYYVSERTSKWKDAEGTCNMAVPDLHPTRDGFKVNIDNNLINSNVWLGLFMKMTVFDYIGCVKLGNQMYDRHVQSNSPGLCYTFCKENEMIGVSIDKCICVNNLGNYSKHETHCTTPCGSRTEGVACGGNGYMSVYKVNKNVSTGSRKTPCLSFERYDNSNFKWMSCSEYVRVVCANDYQPWLISMNKCFKKGLLPISYQALTEIRPPRDPFWSGVISSDVIYNYTEWNRNFQGVRFGYMTANKSVYFTYGDDSRLILCNGNANEWSTAISTFPSTDSERGHSTITIYYNSNENTNTVQLPHTDSKDLFKGQHVSVIIGVSVSVCVVIIAVVAFIVLKRRGKAPNLREVFTRTCCTGQNAMMKDNVDKPSPAIKDSTPETVNSKQECNNYTTNAHTYLELEPSNSDHNMHDMNSHERNEPTANGNIYNEIETESYTNAHVDKKKTSSLDDDYDTTETTAKKLKRKDDNINGDYAEFENNTYNHIGESLTSVSTDQTYNIPHHDDSHSKTDEDHECQDTYSHLNNKQSDDFSNNPDSVYNTTNAFKD